ncbi:PREDICTED: CASP-like protein 1E1 isoform X1 [Lupinus angustifolius]|nr:PREDICTED: CASP-like protein 1E1 isoform X1 [Lupinus angustifolius]
MNTLFLKRCNICGIVTTMEEGQSKGSIINGIEGVESKGSRDIMVAKPGSSTGACDLVLRVLALVLTLVATIVLGVDKQTKIVSVQIVDTLPPFHVPATAEWHYLSAFVYFVVANAIACAYATISLLLSKVKGLGTLISIFDALMVALLFSCNGATTAIGVIGYQGNSHLRWNKVCNVFGKFCNQVAVSIILSLLGSIVFLLLVVLKLRRRS